MGPSLGSDLVETGTTANSRNFVKQRFGRVVKTSRLCVCIDGGEVVAYGFKDPTGVKLLLCNDLPSGGSLVVDVEDLVGEVSAESALPKPEVKVDVLKSDGEPLVVSEPAAPEIDRLPSTSDMMAVSRRRLIESLRSEPIGAVAAAVIRYINASVLDRSVRVEEKASDDGKCLVSSEETIKLH
jgi:hypothetical protein